MPSMELIEMANEIKHKDMSYQDKIIDLVQEDTTDDDALAETLVEFASLHGKKVIV